MRASRDTPTRECKSLDGLWQAWLDAGGISRGGGWFSGLPAGAREMPVPTSYNDPYPDAEGARPRGRYVIQDPYSRRRAGRRVLAGGRRPGGRGG